MINLSDYKEMDEEVYHDRSKCGDYMSSHMLMEYVNNPAKYAHMIANPVKHVDKSAYKMGTATHKYILEGENAFNDTYHIEDIINPKTELPYGITTKKYTDREIDVGKPILSTTEYVKILDMNRSVKNHSELHEIFDNGIAEGVVEATIEGVLCQIRVDWATDFNAVFDLKTTRNINSFEYDYFKYQYDIQSAFYTLVLEAHFKEEFSFYIIAVEHDDIATTGVFKPDSDLMAIKKSFVKSQLRKFSESKASNSFVSSYDDSLKIIQGRK